MLDRTTIRANRFYWVQKRDSKKNEGPSIAFTYGELPSLGIRVLSEESYPSPSNYDFLADCDMEKLFETQFHGLPIDEILNPAAIGSAK